MTDAGGIFLDIFTRLNMASVDRTLTDVKAIMREGGVKSSRAFSEGFTLDSAKAQFGELVEVSNNAYREMELGLKNLQVAEARINNLRAQNFKRSSEEMVAAQRRVDEAISASQKLVNTSVARNSAVTAARSAPQPERGRGEFIPLPRGARVAGAGAALITAGGAFESGRIAIDVQNKLNQIQAQQHTSAADIKTLTDSVWQLSRQTGFSPREISGAYGQVERATNYVTGQGYRGQDAVDVMRNALEFARVTNTSLGESIQAITTTSHDYRMGIDQATALLAAGSANIKGSMDDFASALHSIEPSAQMTGIGAQEIIAALEQTSQTGMTAQQAAPNLANLLKNLGAPSGAQSKRMAQLGVDPMQTAINLKQKGLAGTLSDINAAVAKQLYGPNGTVVLGEAMRNQLEQHYQDVDLQHLSPDARALVSSPAFQMSEIGGYQVKSLVRNPKKLQEVFGRSNISLTDTDIPWVIDWLKKQQDLHGPSSAIKSDKPEIETLLGAFRDIYGTKEAANIAMMLSGSPGLLDQFKGRVSDLGTSGSPNAFGDAFNQAMQSDTNKMKKFGASLESLAGKLGEHLLPIVGTVADRLNDFINMLDRNKAAMDAFIAGMATIGGAYLFVKIINGLHALGGALSMAGDAVRKVGQLMSDRLPTMATASDELIASEATAGTEIAAAGTTTSGELTAAGTTAAASLETGAATAGTELTVGAGEAAGEIRTAAMSFKGALVGATAALVAGMVVPKTDNWLQQQSWYKRATGGGWLKNPLGSMANVFLGTQEYLGKTAGLYDGPVQFGSPPDSWHQPGHARGGIVGYKFGGKVADPQPLMSMPDMKRDSILGLLPDGTPVGLRGGEGILTPEAVAKIGGKDGVDALNNPWADPWNVATTFYGSFAKGVAKYSPWGKYLEASSQTLDALQQEFDQSTEMHTGGKKGKLYDRIIASLAKNGGAWPVTDSGSPRAKSGIVNAVKQAYLEAGFPPDQWHSLEHIISHESSWNPSARNPKSGAYGLGQFLGHEKDKYGAMGAYSGNPYYEARAMMQYIKDRYGNPANAWSFWRGHNWYSKGGVVGFDKGGVVDPAFWSPDDPKGRTHRMRHQHGTGATTWIIPQIPNDPGSMVHFPGNDSIGARAPIPHMPPFGPFADIQDRQNAAHGGIIGFDVGGVVPQPPNITDLARTHGIAPMDSHIAKAPKIADKQAKPKQQPARETTAVVAPPHVPTPSGDRGIQTNPSRQGGMDNTSKGFGVQGGLIGSAEGALQQGIMLAGMGADAMGGGGGGDAAAMAANQAMQIGFQLANRAIGYGGQLLGILGSGLIETFLPNDSPLADPTNNLFGKVALGIAGAHPSPKNLAGQSAMQLKPKQDLDMGASAAKQVLPAVHIDQVHNHSRDANWDSMRRAIDKATFGGLGVGGQF